MARNQSKEHKIMSPPTITTINDVFACSYGNSWQPIPEHIKAELHIDKRIGICGGMLVTQAGARGMLAFVDRLNSFNQE